MGKISFDRVLDCFSLPTHCLCINSIGDDDDGIEREALMEAHMEQMMKLRDIVDGAKTLARHLEPKIVILRVSMHCNGCARKVGKHISKIEGVTSFEVDLESKRVVVMGDITPFEVLESVSKVNKFVELWMGP